MHRTIGQTLRAAREARGLTILDVSHKTRISAGRLQQLEDDNFAAFGNMTYARSFLKGYSRFLDVDASEVADAFPAPPLVGPSDYRYLTDNLGPWIEHRVRPFRREMLVKAGRSPLPTLAGMFTVFVIAGVLLGNHLVERHKTDGKSAEASTMDAKAAGPAQSSPAQGISQALESVGGAKSPVPGEQPETVVRPAVLPKNIPAPDTPSTPVRRPEIVN